MGGGINNDIALKLTRLVEWLEDQIRKNPPIEKKRLLQHALELAHKAQNNPKEPQPIVLLNALLEKLGQPSLGEGRTLFQSGTMAHRSASDVLEKLSHMKLSGPRDQCPRCGESKERCSCRHK